MGKYQSLLLLFLLFFSLSSCSNNSDRNDILGENILTEEVYIIGSHACSEVVIGKDSIASNFLYFVTADLKDTLVSGQFPKDLFHIPTDYFKTKKDIIAFSDEYTNKYKVKITYNIIAEKDKTSLICPDNILLYTEYNGDYQEIIIESVQ